MCGGRAPSAQLLCAQALDHRAQGLGWRGIAKGFLQGLSNAKPGLSCSICRRCPWNPPVDGVHFHQPQTRRHPQLGPLHVVIHMRDI